MANAKIVILAEEGRGHFHQQQADGDHAAAEKNRKVGTRQKIDHHTQVM